jgi:hypothetical protein
MNWRDNILQEIKHRDGIVILTDPNHIITNDDKILNKLTNMEFEIIPFSDSIWTRYLIENKKEELQNNFKLIILYNKNQNNAESEIPFDILQECISNGGIVPFSLDDIFPNLSMSVVEQLDPKHYDVLFDKSKSIYDVKNDSETKDFLLQKIFGISSETFTNNSKFFVRDLIDLHLSGNKIPQILSDYLIEKINKNPDFKNWQLGEIITNSEKFFEFLQNEWEKTVSSKKIFSIPFNDPIIHLDNLFLLGKLRPIDIQIDEHPDWMHIGIQRYAEKLQKIQLEDHLKCIEIELEKLDESSHYSQWQNFSLNWAHLSSKCYFLNSDSLIKQINHKINQKFTSWIESHYKFLRNDVSDSPLMLHNIFNYLVRQKEHSKVALIVMDGMSLSQWFLIRELMRKCKPQIKDNTNTIFAWIPTITSISRLTIFSGDEPLRLQDSLFKSKEESNWKTKWIDDGKLRKDQIFYKKNIEVWTSEQFEEIPFDSKDVLGLVINTIDTKMHSATGGMKDLLNQIHDFATDSKFFDFLEKLFENNFQVFITSDHGNIEAMGIGVPESDFATEPGRRVRIYSNEQSMQNSHNIIDSKIWPNVAVPSHHFLLSTKNNAFSTKDKFVITHGGDSLEEVIVPFVKLRWEK